ncbi:DinB family protein [Paenimyroides viscosum]|uniref:DinB family protein n=1 Tax=Paenimyroides viscosum TaxID=2488729 RepID=A0A3P1B6S1_9FLAO|nr:DinB family protein [Paenimyroides viscosum]RRA96748.1 DinB family protein [Paenimyroides viscosum]
MTEFEKYIQEYLNLIPSENWLEELKIVSNQTLEIYQSLTEEQSNFAYADGKWSLKTLLEHLTDVEKIFHYRALRFARKDMKELAGFDENQYAENGTANQQDLQLLIEEFHLNRLLSLAFFSKLTSEQLAQKSKANGNEVSVETIEKLIVGHNIHHLNIIKERYLSKLKP